MGTPKRSFRERQLGRQLRGLRERRGLTQAEAGERLDYSTKKMSRIEQGQLPDIHGFRAMLDVYGLTCDQWEPYIEMWRRAGEAGWWIAYNQDAHGFVAIEHDASVEHSFQLNVVPGLLQTKAYMRSFFKVARVRRPQQWVDNEVAVRLRRQERLFADPPLELHMVIDQFALLRKFDQAVMREQLEHILERAMLRNVTVQVLPASVGPYDGLAGSFVVLSFPDREEPDLVYVEHAFGAMHLGKASEVRDCRLAFDHRSKLALDPEDSNALLKRMVAEL